MVFSGKVEPCNQLLVMLFDEKLTIAFFVINFDKW